MISRRVVFVAAAVATLVLFVVVASLTGCAEFCARQPVPEVSF